MEHADRPNSARTLRLILQNAALLVVYFLAGKFGLSFFGLIHPSASPIWLPTGVAIAALVLFGRRLWPAIFAGAFFVNVTTAGSIASSLGVAFGNTLEALLAAWLVERFAGGRASFERAAYILRFACLAVPSTAVSATIGVASLTLGGYAAVDAAPRIWLTWWIGDFAGAILATPLLVLWWTRRPAGAPARRLAEAGLVMAATAAVGGIAFLHPAAQPYPLAFLCLAPLVWGALRFGPRTVATAVALLAVIATAATASGRGSFVMPTPNESLLVLQAFMTLIALTALPMAALTAERRTLLERERAARAQADAASSAKDEFLAILSHELRNPLAALANAATVLDHSRATASELSPWISVIHRQTQHLARLIDDLLDIGRVAAHKLSLRRVPLELGRLVERCARSMAAARDADAARIAVAVEPVWIDADPDRIEQIVNNLLGNALKYTTPDAHIRVTVRDDGAAAVLRVADEGMGIEPELLPRVFEPFAQGAQGLERAAGGLGIGLTIVRRFVELHDGTVEARSAGVGQGSEFIVRLPRINPPAAISEPRPAVAAGVQRRRVLIVEDNADARSSLCAVLEALGQEVHEAADGESGVARALELCPDVALVDIGLPRVDGYEVARRLRAAGAAVRLIALTGYGRDDDVARARAAGFDDHVLKPAGLERLRAVLDATPPTGAARGMPSASAAAAPRES